MRTKHLIFFFLMLLVSCREEKKELQIFYSLFPELVSASYHDIRLNVEPLPPSPDMDSIEEKKYRKRWEERRIKLLSDTTKAVILIPDTIHYEKNDLLDYEKQFKEHFKNQNLVLEPVELNKTINLDINKLKSDNKRVRFEFVSKYPDDKINNYRWRPDRVFDGILRVSRIRFDETQNYGYLILSYYRGPLDGWGSLLFIKKVGQNWVIDGSGRGWVS